MHAHAHTHMHTHPHGDARVRACDQVRARAHGYTDTMIQAPMRNGELDAPVSLVCTRGESDTEHFSGDFFGYANGCNLPKDPFEGCCAVESLAIHTARALNTLVSPLSVLLPLDIPLWMRGRTHERGGRAAVQDATRVAPCAMWAMDAA